jgi:UDP-glucose 4-epimerase
MSDAARSVLVTGAAGLVGRRVVEQLATERGAVETIVAADIRDVPTEERLDGVEYTIADVREPLDELLRRHRTDAVVHLAAIVTPGRSTTPEEEYAIDVLGTENVLRACVETGVRQIVITSSGAAYGYHLDNPRPLYESDPLRGNDEFTYSRHKRLVEEMLARYRKEHPDLRQLIFRPGAILGAGVRNQISDMFERPFVLGLTGTDVPFVLIWDEDVARAIVQGLRHGSAGIYNLTGDGTITLEEMAGRMGKPYVPIPALLIEGALGVLKRLGVTELGPEQVNFLRYRPVLANDRLKKDFGFTPSMTSAAVFDRYLASRGGAP